MIINLCKRPNIAKTNSRYTRPTTTSLEINEVSELGEVGEFDEVDEVDDVDEVGEGNTVGKANETD